MWALVSVMHVHVFILVNKCIKSDNNWTWMWDCTYHIKHLKAYKTHFLCSSTTILSKNVTSMVSSSNDVVMWPIICSAHEWAGQQN